MADWDDFGFDDAGGEAHKTDLTSVSTEDLMAEIAKRQQDARPEINSPKSKVDPGIPFPRPSTRPEMTMAEAWPVFDAHFYAGGYCPCCVQRVQLYPRKVYGAVAVFLIWLVRTCEDGGWASLRDAPILQGRRGGGDKDKLKFFGLAEEKPNDTDPKKKSSGFWRPTAKGIQFVRNQITIAKTAWGYNGQCWGYSKEQVTIQEALGAKYDYREVMGQW